MTDDAIDLLLPRPRRIERSAGGYALPARPTVAHADDGGRAIGELRRRLEQLGFEPRPASGEEEAIRLRIDGDDGDGEAYRLTIDPGGIEIASAGEAGLAHGARTLAQWLELHRPAEADADADVDAWTAPALRVVDRPSFRHRGVLLDVSRGKVPTMATLFALVDRLAGWKINQLQLYTEHTFAYRGHEAVWRGASPLTAAEIRALDDFCHERFVELVPNQQSCGHFHRWLAHPRYRPLAECPDGIEHPWSRGREPFGLCPTDPRALELLEDLYAQLLPNFRSRLLNVDLDETFDLGRGRSADACAERDATAVYLDFVRRVHDLAARHGHRIQLWGDVILEHPERLGELPEDVIALAWGYEADHPFAETAAKLAASGRELYLCPGTSSWLSLAGRVDNALKNLAGAAIHGAAAGASGYLITDWGDRGHLQPLPVSYPGFVAGADFAWNADLARVPSARPWVELLDRHVFDGGEGGDGGDGSLGAALLALGDVYRLTGTPSVNGSALFRLLVDAGDDLEHPRYRGLSVAGLDAARARVDEALAPLSADGGLVRRELVWVGGLLALAADLGRARLEAGGASVDALPAAVRRPLAARLEALVAEHEPIWLARNRPGGRDESVAWLDDARRLLAD